MNAPIKGFALRLDLAREPGQIRMFAQQREPVQRPWADLPREGLAQVPIGVEDAQRDRCRAVPGVHESNAGLLPVRVVERNQHVALNVVHERHVRHEVQPDHCFPSILLTSRFP